MSIWIRIPASSIIRFSISWKITKNSSTILQTTWLVGTIIRKRYCISTINWSSGPNIRNTCTRNRPLSSSTNRSYSIYFQNWSYRTRCFIKRWKKRVSSGTMILNWYSALYIKHSGIFRKKWEKKTIFYTRFIKKTKISNMQGHWCVKHFMNITPIWRSSISLPIIGSWTVSRKWTNWSCHVRFLN